MSTCARMRLPRVQLRVPMQWTRYYSESLASSTTASSQTSTATANTTPSADNVDSNVDADADAFKKAAKLRRTVKKHLSNSSDPYIIAQHVETILKKDQYDEALLLTQQASKDQNVVVAWNHLIGYQLEKQRLKAGMKLYNDMKKRSQLPNVQTFTIIFRGLSKSQHPKLAVAEAVKLYNVLLADRRLQPNSIHLNAVLSVCSRANDLDSLFLIANTLNDSTRAATPYTYTTILNALRHHALKENAPSDTLSDEQTATNLQRTVDRARSIWVEVMEKWQAGKLVIDEELVCAMGRVQLLSPKREQKRQVLDLLTQTMNIPNLTLPSPPALTPNTSGPIPGRNTLALILTTLASAKLTSAGMKYWSLLTSTYNIHPDPDNYLRLLGMLKVAKASASSSTAIATLPETSPIYTSPKPYRIAMETCVRDNINNNVTTHSTAILNHMLARLDVPDLHTLRLYLRVALVSHYAFRKNPNQDAGKASYGTQLTTALGNLWEPYKKTHYHYFKATPTPATKTEKAILYNNQREVIALARHMFSAFNKVINEKMLPDAELKDLRRVGAKINKEIVKFYEDREEIEPNLKKFTKARFDNNRANDNTGDYKKPSVRNDDGDSFYEEDPLESGDLRQGGDFVWRTNRPLTQETTRRSAPSF